MHASLDINQSARCHYRLTLKHTECLVHEQAVIGWIDKDNIELVVYLPQVAQRIGTNDLNLISSERLAVAS